MSFGKIKNKLKSNSNVFLIVLTVIVFGFYFLDKDLSKILGIIGFFVWFLQQYSKQLFTKDLEKFKFELQNNEIRFKIKYEKLHLERAEVIKKIYKKIVKTYKSFYSCMCPIQLIGEFSEKEKMEIAVKKFNDLRDYFEENRIFFEENLAKELDELLNKFSNIWNKFNLSRDNSNSKNIKQNLKEWAEAWNDIRKEIPKIKSLIENRFREIIGIRNNNLWQQ